MMAIVLLLLLGSDDASALSLLPACTMHTLFLYLTSSEPQELENRQTESMKFAFGIHTDAEEYMWEILKPANDAAKNDCCQWHDLGCDDGIITVVHVHRVINFRTASRVNLDNGWLPQSITHLDITHANLNRAFNARFLPRRLEHCSLRRLYAGATLDAHATLNLADLPKNLRKLYLVTIDPLFGAVLVPKLPVHIEHIHIYSKCAHRVLLAKKALPESLEDLHFVGKKWKIINVDGADKDGRVRALAYF